MFSPQPIHFSAISPSTRTSSIAFSSIPLARLSLENRSSVGVWDLPTICPTSWSSQYRSVAASSDGMPFSGRRGRLIRFPSVSHLSVSSMTSIP